MSLDVSPSKSPPLWDAPPRAPSLLLRRGATPLAGIPAPQALTQPGCNVVPPSPAKGILYVNKQNVEASQPV